MTHVPLSPPVRKTAADEAERVLFQAIANGDIAPGAPLRLQDLAEQLNMSMMPIREAIRRLQGLGLVEVVAHKGTWVRPLTVEDLSDTYFTRLHLESIAFIAASGRVTEQVAGRARAALVAQETAHEAGDVLESRAAHERFHFELYAASGSSWLVHSIWPVWRNSERYRGESMRHPAHVATRAREHVQMLEALEAGRTDDAIALLVSHLTSSVKLVASTLQVPNAETITLPTVDDLLRRRAHA